VITLRAAPAACLKAMVTAAKPSTQRLHLRNLFAQGRRYQVYTRADGFRLTTTSKVAWHYRRRTASTAILRGKFSDMGDDITRIDMTTRINVGYLLDGFLLPTFMSSIIIFMPWPPLIIAALIAALYSLSWFGHRFNARLEANEMVWFVHKALEDFETVVPPPLEESNTRVVEANREFDAVWERFFDRMQRESTPDDEK
jgi:hypothetical protein